MIDLDLHIIDWNAISAIATTLAFIIAFWSIRISNTQDKKNKLQETDIVSDTAHRNMQQKFRNNCRYKTGKRHNKYYGSPHSQSSVYSFRNTEKRTDTKETGEYKIIHKYRSDSQFQIIFFHIKTPVLNFFKKIV